MTEWISVKERLPEVGEPVWVLFTRKNGEPVRLNPVRDADYGTWIWPAAKSPTGFILGKHRNIMHSPGECRYLTHWQPRRGSYPPLPERFAPSQQRPQRPPEPAPAAPEKQARRPYTYRPGQREAAAERMREQWRKRKAGGRTEMMKE